MAEPLGRFTAAAVREDDYAIHLVAQATGLNEEPVRAQLAGVHGKTLVCNVFKGHWPVTADMLANVNAKLARECALFPEVALVTGLSERTVETRIFEAHGKRTLRRLFEDEWPQIDETEHAPISQSCSDTDECDDEAHTSRGHGPDVESAWIVDTLQVSTEWSRPRRLDRILKLVGMEVPQRLRTGRFQELVDLLQRNGIEMRLVDEQEPLTSESASPGINARVRLRIQEPAHQTHSVVHTPPIMVGVESRSETPPAPVAMQEATDIATSIVEFGLLVSQSDRVIHPLELEKIRDRAQREGSSTAKERLFSVFSAESVRINVEAAASQIAARLDVPARSDLFEHLFEVATADGVIVAEEIDVLRWLERALQPRAGLLDELLHQHNSTRTHGVKPRVPVREHALFRSVHRSGNIHGATSGSQKADVTASVDQIMDLLFSR